MRARAPPGSSTSGPSKASDTPDDADGMVRKWRGIIDAVIVEFDDVAPLDPWIEALARCSHRRTRRARATRSGGRATLIRACCFAMPGARASGLARSSRAKARDDHIRGTPAAESHRLAIALVSRGGQPGSRRSRGAPMRSSKPARRRTTARDAVTRARIVDGLRHLVGGIAAGALRVRATRGLARRRRPARLRWLAARHAAMSRASTAATAPERAAAAASSRRDGPRLRRGDRACVHYVRGWLAALDDDTVAAHREARMALAVAVETGIPWFECLARLALADLQRRQRDRRGAQAQLRGAEASPQRLRSPWLDFDVRSSPPTWRAPRVTRPRRSKLSVPASGSGASTDFCTHRAGARRRSRSCASRALEADIEPEFARALVRTGRLAPRVPPLRVRRWPWPFRIVTFGGFQLLRGDTAVEFSGKGPGRPLELLKVLVALGRHNVRADQLADALWPHMEADYAHKSFTATLHRLRRHARRRRGGGAARRTPVAQQALVWVDTWALEQLCDDFDAALRAAGRERRRRARRGFVDEALALYRGPFLPDESEQPAYIACREQIRARAAALPRAPGGAWEERGRTAGGGECYLRCIDVDELCEPLVPLADVVASACGEPVEALATYERLRRCCRRG